MSEKNEKCQENLTKDKKKVKVRILDIGALPDTYEDTIERVLYWIKSSVDVEIRDRDGIWNWVLVDYNKKTDNFILVKRRNKKKIGKEIISEEELMDFILFLPTPIDTQDANIWIGFD